MVWFCSDLCFSSIGRILIATFWKPGSSHSFYVIASVLMNSFLTPLIGLVVLLPYFALCVFLLWKLPEIAIRRAVVIAAVFVAFKIVEPFVFRALLGS